MKEILPPVITYRGPNDLSSLWPTKAAETLMLYIDIENNRTTLHYAHCGTIGHNLMLNSEDDGHAIWFMIAAEDKAKAEKLFKGLGFPLEREDHFASDITKY
ncbi:hypothetical protein BGZ74_006001 [Mortierella antarctica]|nr:hypothetical protein BGZ74_006001 [Mortierella antarctica]